jgi:hypothetical protein
MAVAFMIERGWFNSSTHGQAQERDPSSVGAMNDNSGVMDCTTGNFGQILASARRWFRAF